jgi:hypothetical protein
MADELDGVIDSTGMVRRTFMRRLVTGTAFAAPVVASFAMAGVEAASAAAHGRYPGPPQLIGNGNGNGGQPCGPQSPIAQPNTTVEIGPNSGPWGGGGPPYGGGGPPYGGGGPPYGGDGPPFFGFWPPPRGFGSGH